MHEATKLTPSFCLHMDRVAGECMLSLLHTAGNVEVMSTTSVVAYYMSSWTVTEEVSFKRQQTLKELQEH